MTMCSAAGLLCWRDDHYENAEDVARYLVKGESAYAGAWLDFIRPGWENWGALTEKLRPSAESRRSSSPLNVARSSMPKKSV